MNKPFGPDYFDAMTPEQKRCWDEMTRQGNEVWEKVVWDILSGIGDDRPKSQMAWIRACWEAAHLPDASSPAPSRGE